MRTAFTLSSAAAAAVLLAAHAPTAPDAEGMRRGAAALRSAGAMTFGPDGTLYVADSRGATLWALDVQDAGSNAFKVGDKWGENVLMADVDARIAKALGTSRENVRIKDMATHPKSRAVYVTVHRAGEEGAAPALVRIRGADQLEVLDLGDIRHASAPVPSAPGAEAKTPWGEPSANLAITDLAIADGELWIAGLSNEQFSSALRRLKLPLGKGSTVNTVEVYHTSHDRWETAAPIDAFLPLTVGGTPTLLAGYGCSPIATFARADFAKAKHLKGKTVAELGGGSKPTDMIRYSYQGKEWILIANSHRTLMRIDPASLASAPAMTEPVKEIYKPAGLGYLPVASAGVLQIDDLNDELIAILERDLESGALNLRAQPKKWL